MGVAKHVGKPPDVQIGRSGDAGLFFLFRLPHDHARGSLMGRGKSY